MAAISSLRHRLWLGYGGLLLILVAVSILTVIVLTEYSRVLQRIFHENYASVVYCDNMKGALDRLNLRVSYHAEAMHVDQGRWSLK